MGGYRGDGYGIHGQYGDEDYSDETREAREGMRRDRDPDRYHAQQRFSDQGGQRYRDGGNRAMLGQRDDGRSFWASDQDHGGNRDSWRAAERYRERFGMQGHQGHYSQSRFDGDHDHQDGHAWGGRQSSSGPFSGSGQDQHYRSWRDRQMQELDRDYQDYCREREQRFHQDFDSWRRNRSGGGQPVSPDRGGEAGSPTGQQTETLILSDATAPDAAGQSAPRASDDLREGGTAAKRSGSTERAQGKSAS